MTNIKLLLIIPIFIIINDKWFKILTVASNNGTCTNILKNHKCLKPSQSTTNNYFVLKKYKLNVCSIGKNFSSMIGAIFCYLFDDKHFLSKHKHLNEDFWATRACGKKITQKNFIKLSMKVNRKRVKHFKKYYKHFIIIRNPVERFLSGFTHLCIKTMNEHPSLSSCSNCKGNMECVLRNLYSKLKKYSHNREGTTNHMRIHFFPQTWLCEYNRFKSLYTIIKYDSNDKEGFYSSLLKLFKSQEVPDKKLDYINWEVHHLKSYHSTNGTSLLEKQRKILYKNSFLLKLLTIIYYDDFKEFNYDLPF
uniref:Sulfotransfer_1 domain-containing protein n=1 Tax=Parastrongyloides trichosuri TaxID=131310 RepID=A0A0N4Z601_PARTI